MSFCWSVMRVCDTDVYVFAVMVLYPGRQEGAVASKVVADVTTSIDLLVQIVEEGTAYEELESLKEYLQWTIDNAKYEISLAAYKERMQIQRDAEVQRAVSSFRKGNAMLAEEVLWDWCLLFRVLRYALDILPKFPPLPWRHDSKYFNFTPLAYVNYMQIACVSKNFLNYVTLMYIMGICCSVGGKGDPECVAGVTRAPKITDATCIFDAGSLPECSWRLQTAHLSPVWLDRDRTAGGVSEPCKHQAGPLDIHDRGGLSVCRCRFCSRGCIEAACT